MPLRSSIRLRRLGIREGGSYQLSAVSCYTDILKSVCGNKVRLDGTDAGVPDTRAARSDVLLIADG